MKARLDAVKVRTTPTGRRVWCRLCRRHIRHYQAMVTERDMNLLGVEAERYAHIDCWLAAR